MLLNLFNIIKAISYGCMRRDKTYLTVESQRVQRVKGPERDNLDFLAFRFMLNLYNLIEPNRKRRHSCVEDSAIEDWAKST